MIFFIKNMKFEFKPYLLRNYFEHVYKKFSQFIHYGQLGVFSVITIETSSYCNRKCPDCPVSFAPREDNRFMDDNIFEKILNELGDMKFNGALSLHFYNEPLADKQIALRVNRARNKVPNAYISLNSNGDFLDNKLLTELVAAGLDLLYVTAYSENAYKRLNAIAGKATENENKILQFRKAPLFIGNRAGAVENTFITEPLLADCYLPNSQLVINYLANVVLCCQDYFGDVNLGNVRDNSLLEIWKGEKFKQIRNTLHKKARKDIKLCAKCNLYSSPIQQKYLEDSEIKEFNRSGSL